MNGLITRSDGLEVIEEITDLRDDRRGARFWAQAKDLLESAEQLVELRLKPKCGCGLYQSIYEARRMWNLINSIRIHGYRPKYGDEIMIRGSDRYRAQNGTHRAAILRVLDMPVPALIVENWEQDTKRRPVKWQHPDN